MAVFKFYNVAPFYRTFYTVCGKHLDMNVQENPSKSQAKLVLSFVGNDEKQKEKQINKAQNNGKKLIEDLVFRLNQHYLSVEKTKLFVKSSTFYSFTFNICFNFFFTSNLIIFFS